MSKTSKNPFQIHFGKKFYKQTNGYFVLREWQKYKKIYTTLLAHRWVWENHHGPIKEGFDIHHIDGDKSNNIISNLESLSRSDHRKEHWNDETLRNVCENQLNKVRPLEWLRSVEGRKIIGEKSKESWKNKPFIKIKCKNCGIEKEFKKQSCFCCKSCYMNWCWKTKKNFVESNCPICDKVFERRNNRPNQCCSKECGLLKRVKNKLK